MHTVKYEVEILSYIVLKVRCLTTADVGMWATAILVLCFSLRGNVCSTQEGRGVCTSVYINVVC